MILKETILSAFTERGTLLKWLKKVEAALNNAVLTDISVEQISATQVKLKFTFENGDFVESPVLTLPRGEKGEPGKDGAPGKDGLDGEGIAATIEVGTVTTGAAGTDASVTNVGTEQRAVLNFVIPRGDTGASGEEGSAGVGFDDATLFESNVNPEVVTGTKGFTIEGFVKVTAGDEIFEIPSKMIIPLTSGEGIVIDVDINGDALEVHLDAEVTAKLARALVTPMSAPASISLVAVDPSNAQTMLTLGSGLSVSGGVLSASGGGGGEALYYTLTLSVKNLSNYSYRIPLYNDTELIVATINRNPFFVYNNNVSVQMYRIGTPSLKLTYQIIEIGSTALNIIAPQDVEAIYLNGEEQSSTGFYVSPGDNVEVQLYTYSSGGGGV